MPANGRRDLIRRLKVNIVVNTCFCIIGFPVFCANATQEEQQTAGYWSSDRPVTLPANITEQLCTVSQTKW